MKDLIVGLGNIGPEYQNSRHNAGFMILDTFAKASNIFFTEDRYGMTAQCKIKNKEILLLKPSTFMNLSGNAVRYWVKKEKILMENLLIIVDDLALPFGVLRLKPKGSSAGHNGLKNIEELLGTEEYSRLRFGLGNHFPRGQQIDYVLGEFTENEKQILPERFAIACEIIKSFCLSGTNITMNLYNNK